MKKLVWIFCILYAGLAHGQKNLKIGDRLPDLPLAKVLYKDNIVSLNSKDYNDKLLIIDFWDTSCSNCIASFPKLDELQKTFVDKIKIITATNQKEDLIRMFKSRNKLAKELRLPIMVEDSLFKSYFPYKYTPHIIWINKGIVMGITGGEYVHKDIITKILSGEKVHLPLKYDFYTYDFKNTSILGSINTSKLKSYSAITGYTDAAPRIDNAIITDSINGTIKEVFLNKGIITVYTGLYLKLQPKGFIPNKNMVFIEAAQPEQYQFNPGDNEFEEDWMEKNAISYEAVFPLNTDEKTRAKLIIEDLNNKLGLEFKMEKRLAKTLVIAPMKQEKSSEPIKNKADYKDQSLKEFIYYLQVNAFLGGALSDLPPITDEVNQPEKIMKVYPYEDLASLKKLLNLNGLDISEQERKTDIYVLSDRIAK